MNDWYVDIPAGWMALATNVVTQGLCIGGVNRLTAVSRVFLQPVEVVLAAKGHSLTLAESVRCVCESHPHCSQSSFPADQCGVLWFGIQRRLRVWGDDGLA